MRKLTNSKSLQRRTILLAGLASCVLLAAAPALADGLVKVDCFGPCNDARPTTLGDICDSFIANSIPVSVACSDTVFQANGGSFACGGATCQEAILGRSILVSRFCQNVANFDAIVTCR